MSTATITAADINKLRQTTGAGMMDCRKALVESDGDFEKAIDYLRKKGQKVAALRSDREAKEGVIIATTTPDNKTGLITTLACETDFVAKNADFVAFARSIMDVALKNNVHSLDELLAAKLDGASISDKINDQVAKIGEKVQLTRFERVDATGVAAYIHGAYRMGVLVGLSKNSPAVLEAGRDIAMQIAAMNPVAVDADSVPAETIAREKAIVTEQIRNDPKMAGKPDEMIDKIAVGKLNAFFKENTLAAQPFVKDSSKTVSDYLKAVDSEVKVTLFRRVQLG
ncbi:MAG: translation elongation factor Ts [Bacteroidota bacterium]|nr:translation elongation factor Ts [Bacteroidota bacterium]MDP4214979.1 translation elongation factor Ts [Bacteroidota bacterium]MDP4256256.1 translation elongation factor Ts [Bacteroidota bacterium]MDP4258646.1 translation elongation factor Ts [Bacteroidota bacterium]